MFLSKINEPFRVKKNASKLTTVDLNDHFNKKKFLLKFSYKNSCGLLNFPSK